MGIIKTIKDITNIVDKVSDFLNPKNKEEVESKKKDITNKEFYDKLNNSNDISFCDVVRKKKQQQIEDLKTKWNIYF